jgi:DNA-binding MarR family transcriptional regulator
MTPALPATTTAIWTRLMRASTRIQDAVETALKAEGLPPLSWYDALWEIEKAATGIRPLALQDRLLLPQYGLSRLVDRMVKAGLVERLACDSDGRGQVLLLTDAGRAVRAKMWPIYASVLQAEIGALPQDVAAALVQGLGLLAGSDLTPEQG